MSDASVHTEALSTAVSTAGQYIVVARRYRPQRFEELVGQEHVAQALSNAIATSRVGHAYLFTGARGVGKTSTARILAKALNCQQGLGSVPCNQCDICQSVSGGDDVDVLEIDGASNRGIDEIRQLRQNVNVRPSRARFKIYIIDEVHMLTREAFNALLKTLEEPPEHVKFIFCTTEPTKIPITILSRCQRFDFAGIQTGSIVERLRQIVQSEGVEADAAALEVLARRAAGSMRDSQSLLEQLLAFAPGRITLNDVNGMLGTAGDERLAELVDHLVARDAAAALAALDAALGEGVEVGQLLEQLFGYFRDCMLAAVNCPADSFLYVSPASQDHVVKAGKRLGVATVLAVMQILEQTLARLRYSTQGRILAELALVRICHLEDLDELAELIRQLHSGDPAAGVAPGRPSPPATAAPGRRDGNRDAGGPPAPSAHASSPLSAPAAAPAQASPPSLTPDNALRIWSEALSRMSGMAAEQAKEFYQVNLVAPNRLVVHFKPRHAFAKSYCERADQLSRFERAVAEIAGRTVAVSFSLDDEGTEAVLSAGEPLRPVSGRQRLLEVMKHPMLRRAGELFGAHPTRVDDPPNRE